MIRRDPPPRRSPKRYGWLSATAPPRHRRRRRRHRISGRTVSTLHPDSGGPASPPSARMMSAQSDQVRARDGRRIGTGSPRRLPRSASAYAPSVRALPRSRTDGSSPGGRRSTPRSSVGDQSAASGRTVSRLALVPARPLPSRRRRPPERPTLVRQAASSDQDFDTVRI